MTYVVTLTDFTPPAREDDQPWTTAGIEEATTRVGPFTRIDDITISPVDLDPADPGPRTFTITNAANKAGWYRIVWSDEDGNTAGTEAVLNAPYRPALQEVARVIRARTYARGGKVGTFTDSTDPTASEVDDLIDDAASDIFVNVGLDLPEVIWPLARKTIALGTVLLIEPSSRDFNEARARYFQGLYTTRLKQLVEAAQDARDGDDPGQVDDRVSPIGNFPPVCGVDGYGDHVPGSEAPWCR